MHDEVFAKLRIEDIFHLKALECTELCWANDIKYRRSLRGNPRIYCLLTFTAVLFICFSFILFRSSYFPSELSDRFLFVVIAVTIQVTYCLYKLAGFSIPFGFPAFRPEFSFPNYSLLETVLWSYNICYDALIIYLLWYIY